jgi:mRNA interferase HigB
MHLISISRLRTDAARFPDVTSHINSWHRIVKDASWKSLIEVQKIYPSAEAVGNFTVFNIKGNRYRLVVGIDYEEQVVYYKYFLTHAEYDRDAWKNDPYF